MQKVIRAVSVGTDGFRVQSSRKMYVCNLEEILSSSADLKKVISKL